MITDLQVFDSEHLPQRLLHREAATAQLIGALDPQGTRQNVLLSGASGVGKTTLAKACLRDLAAERKLWTAHVQTLRAAAELAGEREHRRIREPDVDDAHAPARRTIREANLESLPFSHRFLYALIRRHGEVSSEALWERYDEVASDAWNGRLDTPPTRRARRNHLQKLRQYDLVETTNRAHSACDKSLQPTAEFDDSLAR